MEYLLLLIADVLLGLNFVIQKKYQALAGADVVSGLKFNIYTGLTTAFVFLAFTGFKIEFSVFSFVCALSMALCLIVYTLLGFKVLRESSAAIYSVFLMSGGMLLPYVFGVFVLNEKLTFFKAVGICVILSGVFLSSKIKLKFTTNLTFLCVCVFILNGLVSIISKVHQVNTDVFTVSTISFVVYTNFIKSVLSVAVLPFVKLKKASGTINLFNRRIAFFVILSSIVSGGSYMLQLIGAKTVPASVLYPLITGGSIVLSALSERVFFKEKFNKAIVLGIGLCFVGTILFL